jgi:hypothetical protein
MEVLSDELHRDFALGEFQPGLLERALVGG